jgi:hypothetical protein
MDPINEKDEVFNGGGAPVDINEVKDEESLGGENTIEVKVDKHGLPLVPQPSTRQDDPLVHQLSTPKTISDNCRTGLEVSNSSFAFKSVGSLLLDR